MSANGKHFGFYFDSSACSGCKTCQVACKDRHGLPIGVLWRRVYEVVGGSWAQSGEAWTTDVFAYNVSMACNHCEQPICVEVCPSRAITKRADGIVLLDSEMCVGCKYCSWACPYGALQFDESAGVMTKCSFCAEDLDSGLPPSCVAACPLRALDYGERAELEKEYGKLEDIFPLPEAGLTKPSLALTPHQDSQRSEQGTADIGNWEEVGGDER
jgi:anaerobic dimethyl sulfoxide reductase subunit B (iron-sulfur subunit)